MILHIVDCNFHNRIVQCFGQIYDYYKCWITNLFHSKSSHYFLELMFVMCVIVAKVPLVDFSWKQDASKHMHPKNLG